MSGELFETQVASLSFPCGFGKRNAGVEDESFLSDSVLGEDTGLLASVSDVLVELSARYTRLILVDDLDLLSC
jgi:hypothetical protein